MSDQLELPVQETDLLSNDSDVECSQSVCSDTHSDNTSASGLTEKSTLSESTIHALSGGSEGEGSGIATTLSPGSERKADTEIALNRGMLLPWGAQKERSSHSGQIDMEIRPGEFVMRNLFADFTVLAEKKIEFVMSEPQEKPLSKTLQRGEDAQFDQLLSAFGSVAEHCLPSLLRALFSWYERQMSEVSNTEQKKSDIKQKSIINIVAGNTTETVERSEADIQKEKRDLAVEFIFCLVLIEVLKQMGMHPGHEDLVQYIENLALKHFKYHEGIQNSPNSANIHMISDLYAEVIGVLAQSRFLSVRTRFMAELKELRSKESSPNTTQSIISLLMGMKFFRVKMVPIEEFEASFQFMQECAQYFLEVKDKDIKHALAGLFVEILVPVAAAVKNEVNVPCLKNFVEMLYSQTLDASTKSKHRLALFPLVTCLLCVSQKQFFLQNWHYFLAMCLSHLKNRDPKMCRVALESLYRLLWVYMIRIKCESNSATQSRLQSIVNSLFPKGSKGVVPRDTPLNIFVKIIQFIAQERLDFAMREIVFDLLSVARPVKLILTPERMSIGLRAFLVVADSLQQKEGDPPMPRSVGVLPSGNTLRVRKTFLNKVLTEDTARSIGMNAYFPHVRRVFVDILRALDTQYGRPLMMTNTQNVNKEPDEMITGERKPRIELFRTCVAAVPRLIPDGMTSGELVDLLSRLTVHMDEELRGLSYCSLQSLVVDFPDWRQDVVWGLTQFVAKDVLDTFPQLMDHGLKMILTLLGAWKSAISNNNFMPNSTLRIGKEYSELKAGTPDPNLTKRTDVGKSEPLSSVLHLVEALALVMLCNYKLSTRRLSVFLLKEVKCLLKILNCSENPPVIDVMDQCCAQVVEKCLPLLPPTEKAAVQAAGTIDLQWLADRNSSVWTAGLFEDGAVKNSANYNFTVVDPWSVCYFGFLERDRLLSLCPIMTMHSWPIVFTRLNALYSVVDPTPLNDNRASLLRSATAIKKPPTERDAYMHLWKNYITFAFRVAPLISNPIVRCASPDLSLSSSPDSLNAEKADNKMCPSNISPSALYKLVVPHLRCEVTDIKDAAVYAIGNINGSALRDLLEELALYIREAVDKKQENVRRRRRRDALRLQLMRLLEYIAENDTFGISPCVLDKDTQALHPLIVEYIEGVRYYLENEPDKNSSSVRDLTLHFCYFIRKMIKNFSLETCRSLLKRDLRRNLFTLFTNWVGKYGIPNNKPTLPEGDMSNKKHIELQFVSLQAMSSLLCCGPCFDSLTEESSYYLWLDGLLNSCDEKVYNLAQETVILLLESNPDVSPLLDWVVDKCYTGTSVVADGCFLALATIFSAREYPCDHYTAIINVTLMNTGCPRQVVRDSALQLLQLLDKRFFGCVGPLAENDLAEGDKGRSTLDAILATTYCRSQIHLSRQLALLHPELTMPMFSEITYRFQSARPEVRQLLLQYLLPWLHNMELVDPNISSNNIPAHMYQFYANEMGTERKDGWGSAEATEMVLNNIFYITAKFGDNHPKEIEEVWATLCTSWPNNMKVIIRYLIIVSGMAPCELLPYAKRVVLYLARVQSVRLLDEMMVELQTVETLNCLIERTETPPFYRLTVMRKASSHSDGTNGVAGQADSNSRNDLSIEKGTIHTKRHSGEDPSKMSIAKSDSATNVFSDFNMSRPDKQRNQDEMTNSLEEVTSGDDVMLRDKMEIPLPQPHPLPMPEFGGYFAPLTEYLPDSSQPISGFHRCNVGVMLLCDIVVDGIELDWTVHIPLMLHILFLGLDHTRPLVYQHCKQLLLNLLIVLAQHNDHLTVAHILLNSKTKQLGLGLSTPALPVFSHAFTESDAVYNEFLQNPSSLPSTAEVVNKNNLHILQSISSKGEDPVEEKEISIPPVIVLPEIAEPVAPTKVELTVSVIIKSLIEFLATRQNTPLWNYEDITAKVWTIKSAEQIDIFLQYILKVFRESLPSAHINERWAQTALQLGLSCSSRHYAGRSLQIYRALRVPITSRMLSDILSRLVETVAEQGEDMQGYVTELLLTLEAAVESLESDFRPLDFMKDFFKSTPNLNNKEIISFKRNPEGSPANITGAALYSHPISAGHARSTSYSVSYGFKKNAQSTTDAKDRSRLGNEIDHRSGINKFSANLSRSRSAQSLKLLGDTATQDDKLTILAQLFWLAVSLLESDYEHEFLLAVRLLASVMHRLPLDRPDARDKVEKLQSQLRWNSFPGVHALLLKGCTHPNIYEPVVALLSQLTPLLNFVVVDPSQSIAFPMNVIALLPYMLLNYEDANELCIRAAENIAQVSIEKSKKLENLGTVMNLYSRRTFSKESFQWTKCVVKYLHDTYSHLSLNMLSFLIEILEKGPSNLQLPILNIIHCILHYVDLASAAAQPVNADLLKVIVKYIEGANWKEALKILKLVVSRSSSLVAPPISIHTHWESSLTAMPHPSFSEESVFNKKELPGRTMEFTFDMSQTPVIGRRFLNKIEEPTSSKTAATPRRSCSISPADGSPQSGWKRPWMCQGRVRECLVNLLTTCGQRVGLPKSPSVIFSQTSDLIERQSSMASSTEEVSAGNNDMSGGSRRDDAATEFGVFKDFDFLEYESESIEGESTDNFNWGVRRRPLSQGEDDPVNVKQLEDSLSEKTPVLTVRKRLLTEESSDDEVGSESPLDEIAIAPEFDNSTIESSAIFPPSSLALRENNSQVNSSARSDTRCPEKGNKHCRKLGNNTELSLLSRLQSYDCLAKLNLVVCSSTSQSRLPLCLNLNTYNVNTVCSGSSVGDLGEVTPCNASPNLTGLANIRAVSKSDVLENWSTYIQTNMLQTPANTLQFFHQFQKLVVDICLSAIEITRESCTYMSQSAVSGLPTIKLISSRLMSMIDIINYRVLPINLIWFNTLAISNSKFFETLKYGMLEVQEHLETFCDKKEQATMYCDAVKTTLKLERLSGQQSDFHHEQFLLDLGKALYKLYFQLLLLVEAGNKMVGTLHNSLKTADFKDITGDILIIKNALTRAYEDTDADGGISSSMGSFSNSESILSNLSRLIENEKWTSVILYFKCNREDFLKEFEELFDKSNDVISILNIYCKKLVHDKPEYFVITNQECDLADVFGRLFQVSAAVSDLESVLKDQPSKQVESQSK